MEETKTFDTSILSLDVSEFPKKTFLRNETTRLFKPGDLVCQVLLSFPCFGSNIQTSEQLGISKNSTTTHQSFKPPRNYF